LNIDFAAALQKAVVFAYNQLRQLANFFRQLAYNSSKSSNRVLAAFFAGTK
jgi:hypothetical protein